MRYVANINSNVYSEFDCMKLSESMNQRPCRRDRRLKVNQPTKRAADYWPYLRTCTTLTVC